MKIQSLIVALIITISSYAQQTSIWKEDFIGYSNQTGVVVNGGAIQNSGDYNSTVTKWTLNTGGVNSANNGASGVVTTTTNGVYNPRFVTTNTGGDLIWESETINVSTASNVFLSATLSRIGNLTATDYVDVYWKVGNNPFILINNGGGHTFTGASGEECWETENAFFDLTVTNNTTVQVRVVMNSNSNSGAVALDKVEIFGM